MKIAISTESTLDFQQDLIKEFGLEVIPFEIILGDKSYVDGNITPEEIFEYVDAHKTLPKTTAINVFTYTEYFTELRTRYDAVIHIAMSSGITSTVNNAKNAAKVVEGVTIIDSRSLTTGIGMLAIIAKRLADEGKSVEEIVQAVKDCIEKVRVTFIVERLDYLHMGGRCSGLALFGANMLKLRPRISLKDGRMAPDKKYRGSMEMVVKKYAEELLLENPEMSTEEAFVTYTVVSEGMVNEAVNALKNAGVKKIYKTRCNSTVSSHCGAGTLGIIFINK